MRYQAEIEDSSFWQRGREHVITGRISTLTVTRKRSTLAFRLVRGRKKIRWARSFESAETAKEVQSWIEDGLLRAGYGILDGEDVPIPSKDRDHTWKTSCIGAAGDDTRIVFADVLVGRNDPRGELIVAQARAEEHEDAVATEDRLLQMHRGTLLGPLDGRVERSRVGWRRGFIDVLTLDVFTDDVWRSGWWNDRSRVSEPDDYDLAGLLAEIITHPSGELVRDLTVYSDRASAISGAMGRWPDVAEVVVLLAALAPVGLERLTLRGASFGDVAPLLVALRRLDYLDVNASDLAVSRSVTAPELTELRIEGAITDASLRALADSTWPRLRRIEVTTPVAVLGSTTDALLRAFGERLEFDHLRPSR